MDALFITGAQGFVGRRLLERIDASRYSRIFCLGRQREPLPHPRGGAGNVSLLVGSLFDDDVYRSSLAACDTVVHLAAVTGKAAPEEYFRTNARGTRILINRCVQAGVKNFLYVSTIAVKFPDKRGYPYAQSKESAESAVRSSGLNYVIVRPTIVIGRDARAWKGLARIASLRVVPMLGDGRTRIQPIDVEDLAECLSSILEEGPFSNETVELGGPEEITIEAFFDRIHRLRHGKNPRFVHLPVRPILLVLAALERVMYRHLPVSVGQLASFYQDGMAAPNRIWERRRPAMKTVEQMLALVAGDEFRARGGTGRLDRECAVFAEHLIDQRPNGYVLAKYRDAHERLQRLHEEPWGWFDRFLGRAAGWHPIATRLVDAYTAAFFRPARVREKWALLLAILETATPTGSFFDEPDPCGRAVLVARIVRRGLAFGFWAGLAAAVLLPLHVMWWAGSALSVKPR